MPWRRTIAYLSAINKTRCRHALTAREIFSQSRTCHASNQNVSLRGSAILPTLARHISSHSSHGFCIGRDIMKRGFERDDLMAILDGIDDAVVKFDDQAHFVAMNQAAAAIYQRLGLDPQTMKGKSVWEVFPDLKDTLVERELRSVLNDHVPISFEFFYPKDQHWYETKGYPGSPGAILLFRDITARKAVSPPHGTHP